MATSKDLYNGLEPFVRAGLVSERARLEMALHNGLCECRGPLARHPFHTEPLPPEYHGRHRRPAADIVRKAMSDLQE